MPAANAMAAGNSHHQSTAANWNQRDTAIYVVSTLNLLRTTKGQNLPWLLTSRLGISHFDVYADDQVNNLYFVELRRDNGDIAGALGYQMGWFKPRSVTSFTDKLGVPKGSARLVNAYKNDSRQFVGSFTSTLPS